MARKIVYQNWIVDIGFNPARKPSPFDSIGAPPNERVTKAVREALDKLSAVEREFVRRYYFDGESFSQIATALKKRPKRMEHFHRRVINKLKKHLGQFVKKEYGIKIEIKSGCLICNSEFRDEIDLLIKNKKEKETWKKIIRTLRDDYNITIKTPQILIGHRKYHITKGENHESQNPGQSQG